MSFGKLDADALKSRVLKYTGACRGEVVLGATFGEDSAALDTAGDIMVLSSDPITGAEAGAGRLAVVISANDIISNGAEPVAVLLTLLMPKTCGEADVETIMLEADAAARDLKIEIVGGHTEFTDAVTRPVVSATAVGKAKRLIKSSDIKPGNDLVLTKMAGLEGTAILFSDYHAVLERWFSREERECALGFSSQLSVAPEGKVALEHGATAMHDVTEGGVLGAVYEMATAGGCGVKVQTKKIPVHPVTVKLCENIGINPLKLISSGSLLVATENGDDLVGKLRGAGVAAAVIGQVVAHGMILENEDGMSLEIDKPVSDELWTAIKKLKQYGNSDER